MILIQLTHLPERGEPLALVIDPKQIVSVEVWDETTTRVIVRDRVYRVAHFAVEVVDLWTRALALQPNPQVPRKVCEECCGTGEIQDQTLSGMCTYCGGEKFVAR
jgi:hypothetical protein